MHFIHRQSRPRGLNRWNCGVAVSGLVDFLYAQYLGENKVAKISDVGFYILLARSYVACVSESFLDPQLLVSWITGHPFRQINFSGNGVN